MGFVIHGNGKVTIRAKNFIHARRMILRFKSRDDFTYSQAKRLASYKGYFKRSDCYRFKEVMQLKTVYEAVQNMISEHERRNK